MVTFLLYKALECGKNGLLKSFLASIRSVTSFSHELNALLGVWIR
jgi:hypothetical protein